MNEILDLRQHLQTLELSPEARAIMEASQIPVRESPLASIELRSDNTEGPVRWGGWAVPFDQPALIRTWWEEYFEVFERGSWANDIAMRGPKGNKQIKLCYKHDGAVLQFGGGATAGVLLDLAEDDYGVRYEAETIDTSTGRDLAAELRAGTVDRNSFAFESLEERTDKETTPKTVYVTKARTYEISPVNWPAYIGSVIDNVRSEGGAPLLDALMAALDAVKRGKVLPPAALRTIEEAGGLVREIQAAVTTDEAEEPAGAGDMGARGETAGAVESALHRFEFERSRIRGN